MRPGSEIIQLCLLQSPPFRDTEPDKLKDTRRYPPHGKRFHTCANRPRLVAALAEDLFQYEIECYAKDRFWPDGLRQAQASPEPLQYAIDVLKTLREREIAPTNPKLHHLPSARLQKELDDLMAFVEGLTPDDYAQVDRPTPMLSTEDYKFILARMQQNVLDYGPPSTRGPPFITC